LENDFDHNDTNVHTTTRKSVKQTRVVLVTSVLIATVLVLAMVSAVSRTSRASTAVVEGAVESPATASADMPVDLARAATNQCENPRFPYRTLKLAHEMPVIALLGKPPGGSSVFEASSIMMLNDYLYVVSDDTMAIGKIHNHLQYSDDRNVLLTKASSGGVNVDTTEGGYEAFFFDEDTNTYSGVIEAVSLAEAGTGGGEPKQHYHSLIVEMQVDHDAKTYTLNGACPSDYEFTSANKGFEGALRVKKANGDVFVLGLCEGNYCEGGARGRTPGNGRVILLKRVVNTELHGKKYECLYKTERVIELPREVSFRDYSAIALRGSRVAIASQENAAVWVGKLDIESWSFIADESARLYDFPRNDNCEIVYCNVEGLDWINDNMFVAASDQMKDMGRQPFRCLQKDQAVHVFVIPPEQEVEEDD
jgi:hypothetical protein